MELFLLPRGSVERKSKAAAKQEKENEQTDDFAALKALSLMSYHRYKDSAQASTRSGRRRG